MANERNPSEQRPAEGGIGARSHQAAEQLKSAAEEGASRVRESAESVKEQAAKRARKLSVAVRAIGENMRIDDEQFMARYADTASRRLDDVASYLTERGAQDVIQDAEEFMRRKPSLFFGGAFVAGLALGRFLKSSRPQFGARSSAGTSSRASGQGSVAVTSQRANPTPARASASEASNVGRTPGRGPAGAEPRDPRNGASP